MFNPCIEHCYKRNGKQYNPNECNDTCEYAKAIEVLKRFLLLMKVVPVVNILIMKKMLGLIVTKWIKNVKIILCMK